MFMSHDKVRPALILSALLPALTSLASAQTPSGPVFQLPPINVSALKESADVQKIPVPVTAVTSETIQNAGSRDDQ